MRESRSHFAPVVLLGLASSALAALASAKPWLAGDSGGSDAAAATTALDEGAKYPLAAAVALVLLATWGVLLVTRGGVRRVFAILATLAAAGLVAAVVAGRTTLDADDADALSRALGRTGDVGWTAWFYVAAVGAVLALVAGLLAVRFVARWPEMGRRYDAPTAAGPVAEESLDSDRDLWRALDEGRDPTTREH